MTTKILICLLGLIAFEIICIFAAKWTTSRHNQILQRHLSGRAMESLDEPEREQVLSSVTAEYDRTVYRKVELVVIAYHIPALASWGIATGQNKTPPVYYYAGTMVLWLALLIGLIKVLARLRGA